MVSASIPSTELYTRLVSIAPAGLPGYGRSSLNTRKSSLMTFTAGKSQLRKLYCWRNMVPPARSGRSGGSSLPTTPVASAVPTAFEHANADTRHQIVRTPRLLGAANTGPAIDFSGAKCYVPLPMKPLSPMWTRPCLREQSTLFVLRAYGRIAANRRDPHRRGGVPPG
jgi:hypothetical protein